MNNIHQLKIPAHRLNRSRSAQEINKYVSDDVRAENKPKTAKTTEAKDFSKSEAELVDVTDTLQHVISIIEKKMAKNGILAERNRFTEHEQSHGSAHHDKNLNANSFQQTVSMMKRITEQITDVSRGNTAALIVIEQFL